MSWKDRHTAATLNPRGPEVGIVRLLEGLHHLAAHHHERFGTRIGNDYVSGPAFRDTASALRVLLNSETGRLDCGTLDAEILALCEENLVALED